MAIGASWAVITRRLFRWMNGADATGKLFKTFKTFNRCALFNPPPLSSPAEAGEDEGGGLIALNGLKVLNLQREQSTHV
jgi:hypothetical protein